MKLTTTDFKFEAQSKDLVDAISKATAVLSKSVDTKSFFIAANGKSLYVIGLTGDTFVTFQVDSSITGEGCFCFPDTLEGLLKKRQKLFFTYTSGECSFIQGKNGYKGSVKTIQVTEEHLESISTNFARRGAKQALPATAIDHIKEGIKYSSVADVYADKTLLNHIVVTETGIGVYTFDEFHFGAYTKKFDFGVKFRCAVPSSHIQIISKLVDDSDIKFGFYPECMTVEGMKFFAILPATQAQDADYKVVPEYIKSLKEQVVESKIDIEHLTKIVENLLSIHAGNSVMRINCDKKRLGFKLETDSSSAEDSFLIQGKGEEFKANVEPKLIKDLINLGKSLVEPVVSITAEQAFVLKGRTAKGGIVRLVCALSE